MSLSVLRPKVRRFVRDGSGVLLDPEDFDLVLEEAVRRYSKAKPRTWVADVPGADTFDYELPEQWDDSFSRLEQVEYPAGRREPSLIDRLDFALYRAPAGTLLRFKGDTPAVGETIRLTFTGLHAIDELTTTVASADHTALIYLAAALGCEQLASHYSNAGDSSILADSVDHESKASEYAKRAKRFMGLATELVPIPEEGEVAAASGETSWGDDMGLLTHPHR